MDKQFGNLNINNYRGIIFKNDPQDCYKNAETQRKCMVQMYEASCNSLDNSSTCELLTNRLNKYSEAVIKEGHNIYNDLLYKTFSDISSRRQFKISRNLPKLDLSSYLSDLSCTNSGKLYCDQSEKMSKTEHQQFLCLFNIPNEQEPIEIPDKNRLARSEQYPTSHLNTFKTARDELEKRAFNKFGTGGCLAYTEENASGFQKKKLGMRRTVKSKFVSPLLSKNGSSEEVEEKSNEESSSVIDNRLKHIEPKMVELISAEIMDQGPNISWNDIAGLEFAKSAIQEAVVWPMLRPDIFTGLRRPPKGILLFGPPGTGKTLIGKCVASQSKSTFFSISASTLTSKWIGDGEKMVRALFTVARVYQPAVIFIDEVDSLLTQRSDTEHESSRRIKTEFLVELDGATTDSEERLLVIGATNRPQELDEAARRRFVKRLYIPLPEYEGRLELIKKLISNERHLLNEENFKEIAQHSDGYSGADIKNLCSEASLGPIRSMDFSVIEKIRASDVRPLTMEDFTKSFRIVRPSVSQNDLTQYLTWDKMYGSGNN